MKTPCGSCVEGKMRKSSFRAHDGKDERKKTARGQPLPKKPKYDERTWNKHRAQNEIIFTRIGDLVHMDGITSPCADEYGNIGALVFKDEATKKARVFPYKHRTQVYDIIPELDRHIQNVFHGKLKIIRTDNAPEFTGKAYESMRKTLAFTTQYSAAYEPAQNPEAERNNGVLQNLARSAMLAASSGTSTGDTFWSWAMIHAAHVRERIGQKRLGGRTTFQMLYGYPPDISNMKVWGCSAWGQVPTARRTKWDSRATRGIYVGDSPDKKARMA